jgi:hypothetical protein
MENITEIRSRITEICTTVHGLKLDVEIAQATRDNDEYERLSTLAQDLMHEQTQLTIKLDGLLG